VKEDARNFILELVNWEGPPPPAEQNLSGHKENAASIPLVSGTIGKASLCIHRFPELKCETALCANAQQQQKAKQSIVVSCLETGEQK